MKIQRSFIVPIVISLILFFLPFFWFKPGEMDLGGDNTRLYFYDPLNYILNQTLYNVVSSGIGGPAFSYYAIPYMLLLKILKSLVDSPTILISIINGLNLSVAFISIYFIVKELSQTQKDHSESGVLESSAILAGFFYIFSPYLIAGWDRNILTHSQFFLNPLMFLLVLRYFITKNIKYLLASLFVTFIFSINFTYLAAPPVFSFYPFSLLFLFLYTKYIRKTKIPLKGLFFGFLVFMMLQSFHIIPHVLTVLVPGSQIGKDVLSEWSRFSKGQDYFAAIAPSVKVSISWMNLLQGAKIDLLSYGFIVFPFIALMGFIWGRKRVLCFIGIFFLLTLFFATANITDLGFNFYKSLFCIPGFSMFRNFYGQWGFVFVFFYSLLIGLSLQNILDKVNKKLKYIIITSVFGLLFINAWPFINGSLVHIDLFQTDQIKPVIQMDPEYEKVLNYVRNLPVDGKMLSFPFTDPGYQIIVGENGGAYIGPSTFSFLTGKSDFSGYEGIIPFAAIFLNSVRNNDSESLYKLFSILNIRYVFYNSDPRIYDSSFFGFPYSYVKDYLPHDQKSYKKFIEELPITKNKSFGENYHIYNIKDTIYFPHIFTSSENIFTNNPMIFFASKFNYVTRSAIFSIDDLNKNTSIIVLEAENISPLFELLNNYHLHHHAPFSSINPNSFLYPFMLLKEQYNLMGVKNKKSTYLDFNLFFASKRIEELRGWKQTIKITEKQLKEPKIWEFYKLNSNNTWEGILGRYQTQMEQIIEWAINSDDSNKIKGANKIKINEQLLYHKTAAIKTVEETILSERKKKYLSLLINNIFASLFIKLNLEDYKAFDTNYILQVPKGQLGEYEIYLEKIDEDNDLLSQTFITIDNQIVKPIEENSKSNLLKFNNIVLKSQGKNEFTLHLPIKNLIKDLDWENSGEIKNIKDTTEFYSKNTSDDNSGGLNKEIVGWRPNEQYLISFDYQTYGDNFTFIVYDKKYNKLKGKNVKGTTFFERNLNSMSWKTDQLIVSSSNDSAGAFIKILGDLEKNKTKLQIRNLSVIDIAYPKIYFKKIITKGNSISVLPEITFTKINPTKYIIKVSNAQNPYTLIFLEAFDQNWNLVDQTKNTNSFKSKITRLLAVIGEKITSIFIKNKPRDDKTTASYFNGEVKEGKHANIFLEPNTFETWGKDSIASGNHFPVYGYANAWNITPEDMSGKTDYTLILEMGTQKKLYVLLCISIFTFLSLVMYLLMKIFRKNEKNN